jgi:citrate lyase beta subunit
MRHFDFLGDSDRRRLFFRAPQQFSPDDDMSVLAVALGATLYSPATRPALALDISRRVAQGVLSSVVCLEDAIADEDLVAAEQNAVAELRAYAEMGVTGPLIFVRVRSAGQIPLIVDGLGEHIGVLSGFVVPKFTAETGPAFLDAVDSASIRTGRRLLAMPVLESRELIYAESRIDTLVEIRRLLEKYRHSILVVRIGATDLSSAYGLRRSRDVSVYDMRMISDVIADVVNILGRADGSGFVVTGPTWEYFPSAERMFKPQLRESPFVEHAGRGLRAEFIAKDLDGLIREIALDKVNGLTGKTVIHPTHVAVVHALSVVTHEEFSDASDILGTAMTGGGAKASTYRNKMNEGKPHRAWAERIMDRARVFGVANADISFVDLLAASVCA